MDIELFEKLSQYEAKSKQRIEHVKDIVANAPADSLETYITYIIQTISTFQRALVSDFEDTIRDLTNHALVPYNLSHPNDGPAGTSILSFSTSVKQTIREMEKQGKLQVIGGMKDRYVTGGLSDKVYLLIDQPASSTVS